MESHGEMQLAVYLRSLAGVCVHMCMYVCCASTWVLMNKDSN